MHNLFFFCAIIGSALIVLQFLATLFGFGCADMEASDAADLSVDGNLDSAVASDADGGFDFLKALSFRTLTAGVAFWGFGGLIAESLGVGPLISAGIAATCGIAAIIVVFYLLRMLSSFNHNGSIRVDSTVGSIGSVYLKAPARRGGVGKVIVTQQERSVEYDALTDEEEDLKVGTPIIVVSILSTSQVLVAKIKEEGLFTKQIKE